MQTPAFALIGRSHSSDAFELLYQASLLARAERRALERARGGRPSRRWRNSHEPSGPLPHRLAAFNIEAAQPRTMRSLAGGTSAERLPGPVILIE